MEKNICIWITLPYTRNKHNIVSWLYFNKKNAGLYRPWFFFGVRQNIWSYLIYLNQQVSSNKYILKKSRLRREGSWRRLMFIKESFHYRVSRPLDCMCQVLQPNIMFLLGQFPWKILMSLKLNQSTKEKQKGPKSFRFLTIYLVFLK